jgi:uncharacterized protein (TIGR02996 family)
MARNLELEALIAKAPDDVGNYNVYADWLIQQGDPRGELINAQLKYETATAAADRSALEDRIGELHAKHDAEWLGELATQKQGFTVTWRRGFLHEVTLGDDDAADIAFQDLYAKLRPLPVAQLFRAITFAAFQDDDQPTWDSGVTAMVEHGVPATLRKVVFDRGSYWDISGTYLNVLEPLYALAPDLEHLEINLGNMELGTINLPNLRHFEVWTGGFTSDNMKAVVAATWPKLETLLLRFGGSEDYGANTTVEDVLPLLAANGIPNVRHLALANSPFIDALIPHLAKSPLLKQITKLDLSLGEMSDAGATAIVEHAAAFKHLESLNVHRNYLSEASVTALKGVVANVDGGGQEDPDDDYRYCQIGE